MSAIIFLIVGMLVNFAIAAKNDIYSGYSVHGVELRDRSDQIVLSALQTDLNVDLWDHGAPGTRDAYVMVSPENRVKFLDTLDANNMRHYIHLTDVAKSLNTQETNLFRWRQTRQNLVPFQHYSRYAEVNAYMERLAREYPSIVTLVTAGNSFEGRAIKYLKISTTNFEDTTKPVYFLDAMMHGREWVTTPVTTYAMHRLVEDLRDGDRDLLENVDWIILPIVNPDGYEYTHTTDRLWRGTRSFNATRSPICYGVDPNRNFDIHFNTMGVSSDPCSGVFPGHEPFSEPETRIMRDIMWEYLGRLQMFMDVHSFGNYVLFGHDNGTLPSNAAHLHHVSSAMGAAIDALKLPQAPFYMIGNTYLIFYGTSGASTDYAQELGIPFSLTLELPGYNYVFEVPPQYIEQINAETWQGFAATARLSYLYYRARNQR